MVRQARWVQLGNVPVRLRYGRRGSSVYGSVSHGRSWFVLVGQASLGELGYVLYCVEVRRGISR
jgi:hypothetical protein